MFITDTKMIINFTLNVLSILTKINVLKDFDYTLFDYLKPSKTSTCKIRLCCRFSN